jgi:Tol biopolymer transport system component
MFEGVHIAQTPAIGPAQDRGSVSAPSIVGIIRGGLTATVVLTLVGCQGEASTDPEADFPYDIVVEQRDGSAGPPDLVVLDLATGDARRLLGPGLGGMHASGSLDGTRVAFVRADAEFHDEIFLVNPDGTGLSNISNHADDDVMPAISPAGSRVAFVTDRDGFQDIFVVNTDGTGLRRITPADPSPAVTTEWWPAWSPNSQLLAYSSTIDGTADIWTITVDATTVTRSRITGTLDTDVHPTWSHDGLRIAFERRDANTGETDIIVLTLSDRALQTIRLPGQQLTPAWSPDGSLIAFASNHEDTAADLEIYTMRPDGTDVVRRTNNGLNDLRPTWLATP